MRSIVLKKGPFSTVDVLREVLTRPGPAGVTANEMRDRLRLLQLLEDCDGQTLDLDNVDFQAVVQMIEGFRFGVVTRDLIDVVDGITGSAPVVRGNGRTAHETRN